MTIPNVKATHIGKKIERIRELKGMKQETMASELGMSQQSVSRLESSENIEDSVLEKVAKVLGVQAEAIKNFSEEAVFNYFNNFNDNSSGFNYHCTFNPIDKLIEVVEENRKLYERLLREKDGVIEMYKQQQRSS